ncbi:NAD(P)-binding domain-containing protein [Kineosporia succinea]
MVVIGAGQAGLSAAYHLKRRGTHSFVVLDAEPAPGGAWRHRWESLTMTTVNGIFDLPGFPSPPIDADEPSRVAVPRYFAAFEEANDLPIQRPVRVSEVRRNGAGYWIGTDHGTWLADGIINATGTWTNPTLPPHPGRETFTGRQLHTSDYVSAAEFSGQRVAVVGGGISALEQLEEISRDAATFWYTRREPVFREGAFEPEEAGRETIAKVVADVEAGRPTGSVVSYTGLIWTPYALAARERGVLRRRPMFTAIEPTGVREADGSFTPVDVILWATGFRPALKHLEPLGLRNDRAGSGSGEPRSNPVCTSSVSARPSRPWGPTGRAGPRSVP